MEEVVIQDIEGLERKKKEILTEGSEKFHVISDFDKTLTYAFIDGERAPTAIAQLRNDPDFSFVNKLIQEIVK